jgi:hypothetical protein
MSLIGSGDRNWLFLTGPSELEAFPLFHLTTEANPASATSPKTLTDVAGV